MKRQKIEIVCNICGKVLDQHMHGVALYRGKEINGSRETWLSTRCGDGLEKHDVHICNQCHGEVMNCFPGQRNNPC